MRGRPRALPGAALPVLTALLAGVVIDLTWPTRGAIFCEGLPQLAALSACAAALLVLCFRALAAASGPDARRLAAGSAILAGLAFFLSAHFIVQYRRPCAAVQQQLHPSPSPSSKSQ